MPQNWNIYLYLTLYYNIICSLITKNAQFMRVDVYQSQYMISRFLLTYRYTLTGDVIYRVTCIIIDSFFVRGSRGRHHKDFHWGGLDGTGEVERLRQKQDPGREGRMGLRQGTSGYVTSQQTTISTSVWSYYYYQHIYSYNLSY